MDDNPAVSIIIPTFRHRDFVMDTVKSVFAQDFRDFELIVVNDGSPDDTAAVLQPLVESNRIRYIEQANAGQAAARNRGIALATGEFVAMLDDDDLWPPDHLQWQVDALRNNPDAVLVYGQFLEFGDANARYPVSIASASKSFDEFARENTIVSPGQALIRASALSKVGGFDPHIWGSDDWDLYLRLAKEGRILYYERLALNYRIHSGNASKNIWKMYKNGMRVVDKHFPHRWRGSDGRRAAAQQFVRRLASHAALERFFVLKQQRRYLQLCKPLALAAWIQPRFIRPDRVLRNALRLVVPHRQ